VRGANTAFQDAQALGWQLAYVARGLAPAQLLQQGFSAERVGAAREIIDEAGKSTRFMTPPSPGFKLLRDAVLSLSLRHGFVRPLYHWRTSRPHEYTHSMLNALGDDDAMFGSGPARGAPPRNVRLGEDHHLLDHLGGGFDLLYFSAANKIPQPLRQAIDQLRGQGVPICVTAIGSAGPVAGADQTIADAAGHCRARYGVTGDGAAYLLRPDQHVCARWLALDANRLIEALATALPR
jgi:3-(3-hydroxy-phenyl)propionate hydroxylase